MTRDQLLDELREVLNAAGPNITWKDTDLLAYLAEGQDMFCEDTGFFRDKTNFSITIASGTATYDIPDRVIQILEILDGTRKLDKDEADAEVPPAANGDPSSWRTDQETGTITFNRTPTDDEDGDTFTLRVWRYSRYALDGQDAAGDDAQPEIPSRFHRACIEWACYKAFNHHDIERQDPVKAKDHLNSYKMYKNDGITAFRRYHNVEARVGSNPAYRT